MVGYGRIKLAMKIYQRQLEAIRGSLGVIGHGRGKTRQIRYGLGVLRDETITTRQLRRQAMNKVNRRWIGLKKEWIRVIGEDMRACGVNRGKNK